MNQIHHDVCATSEGNRLSKSAGVVTPLGVQQGEAWVMLVKLEFDQHKNRTNSNALLLDTEKTYIGSLLTGKLVVVVVPQNLRPAKS
jgi:hypothetical protein